MSEQPRRRRPARMGPWRMMDLLQATVPWRGAMFGGAAMLPEYGPPDAPAGHIEPDEELPGSNIAESEQRNAIARESVRRMRRRRGG